MTHSEIIDSVKAKIKEQFYGEATGHDWYHIERVWKTAKYIAQFENTNLLVVELSALLHDIADHKFVENHHEEAEKKVTQILSDFPISKDDLVHIIYIVQHCSFKGGVEANKINTKEGFIIQDADKLDAIGAIGIARTFAYGGSKGSPIYDPNIPPIEHLSVESYKNNRSHTINHFYEKLLKLKDLMHTPTAIKLAEKRHQFMLDFLDEFYMEWETKFDH